MTVPQAPTDADVLIIGAGIAGLVVAHDLARAGHRVVVIESASEVGGLLRRGTVAGVTIDMGAESFATRTDAVAALLADAQLDLDLVVPRPQAAWLAIATDEGVVRAPLPRRTVLGVPADPGADDVVAIIGPDGAARARAERPEAIDPAAEPSLYDLVTARLGARVANRLVDPLCRSVYSRPAADARLSHLHPGLWREFVARGSLLAAAGVIATEQRAGAAVGGIAGGMWQLPVALAGAARAHGADIRTGVKVRAVRPGNGAIIVHTAGDRFTARRVVIATGPAESARLLADDDIGDATGGGGVRVVAAAISHPGLAAEPIGTGIIVDAALPAAAKALTHITAKWAWARAAAPSGIHLVRLSARDAAAEGLHSAGDVAREVATATGLDIAREHVVDMLAQDWPDAVVREVHSGARPAGIHLAGATVAGTGLASVIPHARALAADIDALLIHPVP